MVQRVHRNLTRGDLSTYRRVPDTFPPLFHCFIDSTNEPNEKNKSFCHPLCFLGLIFPPFSFIRIIYTVFSPLQQNLYTNSKSKKESNFHFSHHIKKKRNQKVIPLSSNQIKKKQANQNRYLRAPQN